MLSKRIYQKRVKHKLAAVTRASHTLNDIVTACCVTQGSSRRQEQSLSSQVVLQASSPSSSPIMLAALACTRMGPAQERGVAQSVWMFAALLAGTTYCAHAKPTACPLSPNTPTNRVCSPTSQPTGCRATACMPNALAIAVIIMCEVGTPPCALPGGMV